MSERLLDAGQNLDTLSRLVDALDETRHAWALRLVALAVARAAQSQRPPAESRLLSRLVFELAGAVLEQGDDAAAIVPHCNALAWGERTASSF